MSIESNRDWPTRSHDPSVWAPLHSGEDMHLISAGAPQRVEINGAPVTEQFHEYVLRKPKNAQD